MRRVACEPHLSLSEFRSYDVNTVFGGGIVSEWENGLAVSVEMSSW